MWLGDAHFEKAEDGRVWIAGEVWDEDENGYLVWSFPASCIRRIEA